MPAKVILVRHGETAFNRKTRAETGESAERIRGWRNVPLDDEGQRQAEQTAKRIAGTYDNVDAVYTSPLSRARDTADRIAEECGTRSPHVQTELMPWNVGHWTGERVSEVLPQMVKLSEHAHQNEKAPGGESFRKFLDRFLECLIAHLSHAKQTGDTSVLVCHTRNIQAARAWVAAGAKPDRSYDEKTMNDYGHEIPTSGEMVLEAQ